MNKKNRKTLELIYKNPTPSNIPWKDIETLFNAVGCEITEGSGSRIRIKFENERAIFHRPHPQPHCDKGAVNSAKKFLRNIGVKP